jgi:mono/diheme cytochrome c family protein
MRFFRALACLALAAAPAAAQDAELAARGEALFLDHCAVCHGADAKGQGPMTPALRWPAPDLTTLAGDGAFPVLEVVTKIDGRDPLASHGSQMPVWGPYFEEYDPQGAFLPTPSGQPVATSAPVAALVAWLESVQGR